MQRRHAAWAASALVLALLIAWVLRTPPSVPPAAAVGVNDIAAVDAGAIGANGGGASRAAQLPPAEVEAVASSGVRLRLKRRPRIDPPAPPYGAQLADLQAAADQGNALAQYRLGLMLYQCREVPSDASGLSRAVEEIHQTRSRDGWDVADPAQEEQALRTAYAHCAGIPAPTRSDYRTRLRAAADAGLIEAQLNLMFHLPPGEYCQYIEDCTPEQAARMGELRDEAREQVGRALDAGSVEALRTVGGWHLNEEMGTPDPVEAWAHFSAYDQIQQAAGRERELTAMLDGIESRLRPVDLERARARARELLSNPHCCVLTR